MDLTEDFLEDILKKERIQREKRYVFDNVFDSNSTQQQVFENTTKFLIDFILKGYNTSVFAYGSLFY